MTFIRCGIACCFCLTLTSCGDGQAGANYRGEPLLSMEGVVASSSAALIENLVPALAIMKNSFVVNPDEPMTTHFLRGEVEGTFPSAFTLRIYEPPPSETLTVLVPGEPGVALAALTAVSPQHPAWLRTASYEEEVPDGVTTRNEMCSPDECISGSTAECPSPTLPNADATTLWPCGSKIPGNRPWQTYGHARDLHILYVDGPVVAGSVLSRTFASGAALAKGYYVFVRTGTPSVEEMACSRRANTRAVMALNQGEGTNWTEEEAATDNRVDRAVALRYQLQAFAAENCHYFTAPIDTAAMPVALQMIDRPILAVGLF